MMKKMYLYAAALAALSGAACMSALEQRKEQLQSEYARQHAENCKEDYEFHVTSIQKRSADLRAALPKTVRAEWSWSMDCDEALLLPKPVKLSRSEFARLKEILAQAAPMPPRPQEAFMTPAPQLKFTDVGEPLLPVRVGGCCGGVYYHLVLQDKDGNDLFYVYDDDFAPASRVSQWLHQAKTGGYPNFLLPDDAYTHFFALPSVAKVKTADAALQKKLAHTKKPQ